MKVLFLLFMCLAPPTPEALIESHIKSWFSGLYPKVQERALSYIPKIAEEANKHDLDPFWVATVITVESGWRHRSVSFRNKGNGLMQVHGVCAKGYDLNTPEGQIEAGVSCFRKGLDLCGEDFKKAVTIYLTGTCTTKDENVKKQVRYRLFKYKSWKKKAARI